MRNFLAVARREFRSAFDLPIAYVFIAAFLILSTIFGLLGFFDRGVSDLRDYFQGVRYSFVLFAPAVSMRLWAEERRSRTFELLFTLPVRPWEAVLGKFLGALGLVLVALALGGALPLSLAIFANARFDPGAAFAGYLGVVLLASVQIALGLLVSALTDNQIVAFVGAAVASFVLLIAGEPAILAEAERIQVPEALVPLRAFFLSALSRIGTGEHQDALARGVLTFRDLVYFGSFTAFFLFGNVLAVERRKGALASVAALVLAGLAFLLACDLAARRNGRLDLTSRSAFSLHPGTKAALSGMDARLTVRCYLSRDLPAADERRKRNLLDLLREIEAQGGRNVRLEVYDPHGDEKIAEQAKREGVQSIQRQHVTKQAAETKIIWGGLSLLYAGKPPVAIPYALYQDNLEYDLAVAIKKLLQKEAQRIAWIEPVPTKAGFSIVRAELGRSFTVETFDTKNRPEIGKDYQTAVAVLDANAPSTLADRDLYELDQFLVRGGSLVLLVAPMKVDARTMRATPIDWGRTAKCLEKWGLSVPPRLVLALSPQMHAWWIPSPQAGGRVHTDKYVFFAEPSGATNPGSPVAGQLDRAIFPFVGEVVPAERPGAIVTRLVRTAQDSWTLEGNVDLDPLRIPVPQSREPRTIVAAISGEIPSAFDAPVPPAKPGEKDPLAERLPGTKAGRLVVFANSDFVLDAWREQLPDAYPTNVTLFLNTVEWASQDVSLATMRTRSTVEPLEAPESAASRTWALNLFGMPLLVGVAGIVRFALRRRAGRRAAELSRKGAA